MTRRAGDIVSERMECFTDFESTYNLELNGHNAEVDQLHCWPNDEVRFECWHVDVLEFASDGALAAALADGHECEEASQT